MKRFCSLALLTATVVGCADRKEAARADSLQAVSAEQSRLAFQLSAQKDSLTTIVLDADAFIARIDSQVSRVKGLPKKGAGRDAESPIEQQLQQRKLMLARVTALVDRAQATAKQLEASRKREKALKGENAELRAETDRSRQLVAELGATIQRQTATIDGLSARVDSLSTENVQLGKELHEMTVAENRAFYIVGTERELLEKKVIVRSKGANLLVARVGRTLQPARTLDRSLFTQVDLRSASKITMPNGSKRYRVVSRQSLNDAEFAQRDKEAFRGALQIKNAQQFWAPSKYLIIVEL
jgi:regulator of replication initiation timing